MQNRKFNKRNLRRRHRRFSSIKLDLDPNLGKNIFTGILLVIFLSVLSLGVFWVLSGDFFRIKNITSLGHRSAGNQDIENSLSEIKNRLIFFVRKESIVSEINKDYPEIKVESIIKYWPDSISIVMTESDPLFFYTNLNGSYLLNDDGKIINILFQDKVNFSEDQIDLITGVDGVNSPLVVERIKAKYLEQKNDAQETEEEFDFFSIPIEEKLQELSSLKTELTEESSSLMNSYQEKYDKTLYPELNTVYAFENNVYSKGEFIDKNKLQLTREVVKFFNQVDQDFIKEIYWEGDFIVNIHSSNNQITTFGTNRDVSVQLSDYIAITNELRNEGYVYKEIDLTSSKISVK